MFMPYFIDDVPQSSASDKYCWPPRSPASTKQSDRKVCVGQQLARPRLHDIPTRNEYLFDLVGKGFQFDPAHHLIQAIEEPIRLDIVAQELLPAEERQQ